VRLGGFTGTAWKGISSRRATAPVPCREGGVSALHSNLHSNPVVKPGCGKTVSYRPLAESRLEKRFLQQSPRAEVGTVAPQVRVSTGLALPRNVPDAFAKRRSSPL
jgi:hypothetical protein